MHKRCSINLLGQKIRIENAFAKTFEQIDELIKQDLQYLRLDKSENEYARQVIGLCKSRQEKQT